MIGMNGTVIYWVKMKLNRQIGSSEYTALFSKERFALVSQKVDEFRAALLNFSKKSNTEIRFFNATYN